MDFFEISAVTKKGVNELIDFLGKELEKIPEKELYKEEIKSYTLEDVGKDIEVVKLSDNEYEVLGSLASNLIRRVNLEDSESMAYFLKMISKMRNRRRINKKRNKTG